MWSLLLALVTATAPTAEAVTAQIQSELQGRLRAQGSAAVVQVEAVRMQALPAGTVQFETGEVAGRWPRARASVPVKVRVDGRVLRTLNVPVTASDVQSVQVFDAAYAARTGLDAVRLHEANVDMVCCGGNVLAALPAEGYRLRHDVRAGAPLTDAVIEPMPAVQGMQDVQLLVRHKGIELSAAAVALQDGQVGERIAVRPSYARETVVATVTAPGKVQIHE